MHAVNPSYAEAVSEMTDKFHIHLVGKDYTSQSGGKYTILKQELAKFLSEKRDIVCSVGVMFHDRDTTVRTFLKDLEQPFYEIRSGEYFFRDSNRINRTEGYKGVYYHPRPDIFDVSPDHEYGEKTRKPLGAGQDELPVDALVFLDRSAQEIWRRRVLRTLRKGCHLTSLENTALLVPGFVGKKDPLVLQEEFQSANDKNDADERFSDIIFSEVHRLKGADAYIDTLQGLYSSYMTSRFKGVVRGGLNLPNPIIKEEGTTTFPRPAKKPSQDRIEKAR